MIEVGARRVELVSWPPWPGVKKDALYRAWGCQVVLHNNLTSVVGLAWEQKTEEY